jgi:2-methylaconitate cis-trans-isomerase PrpF
MFPAGGPLTTFAVPGIGDVEATLINAGNPTIFIDAATLGLKGTELQADVNANAALLARAESIRAHGALAMGLVRSAAEATEKRPATPKLAFVAPPASYTAADGRAVKAESIGLVARIFSMGPLHHAMTGTGAIAIAVAASIPGTLVHRIARCDTTGRIRFGHPSGTLTVGATARKAGDQWCVDKVAVSRSARRLMEGWVRAPRA